MEIRTNLNPPTSVQELSRASSAASSARQSSATTGSQAPSDQVNISSLAGGILATANASEVRAAKVADLKAAVANGTYKTTPEEIASSILDSPLNMHF